jgi:hypothetical protein
MNQVRQPILSGKKEISRFVGRSWEVVYRWINERDFPARKVDGIRESDTELIIQWRQRQIMESSGR